MNDRCYATLEEFRALSENFGGSEPSRASEDARQLERLARDLTRLELDISLEVEAQQHVRLTIPLLPVEEFAQALGDALGLPGAGATTGHAGRRTAAGTSGGSPP